MYRFANHLSNGKLVLVRKKLGEGTCALMVMRAPSRGYATPLPPSQQPKKSGKLFWGTVGACVLTGAAVVYAKGNSDARNWLSINMPWADDFIAVIYQENSTYMQTFFNKVGRVDKVVSDFMFGKEGVSPIEMETRPQQDLDKDYVTKFGKKDYQSTLIQTEKCDPTQPTKIEITKDLVDLEYDMHEATKIAIDNFKKATKFCIEYNKALYKIVETSVENLHNNMFSNLSSNLTERDNSAKTAQEAAVRAKTSLEALDRLIKAGAVHAPPEAIASTKRYIEQFRKDLDVTEKAYKVEVEKSVISDKYWHKVEAARNMFKEEIQNLFPGIDLSARQLNFRGDADLLLLYALKQVQFLQNELAELQTVRELKLNRALECHDEKELIEAKVEDVVKRERAAKERDYMKKNLLLQAEADKKLREELTKQMEIQQALLRDQLAKKEKEIMDRFAKSVSEQVEKERVKFKQDLAVMAGKLTAIDNTMKQRAKAEEDTKRSQSLWTAAEALLAATRRGCALATVDKEIQAVERAGHNDKLVETVMKGIPESARKEPILTEQRLREQFDKMEQSALKVALVGKNGGSLPVYFLSWVQSKLLFSRASEIPINELENNPVDFTKLDTFDIIQRARYCMDQNNISAALRYLNLLQGASRAAAKAWCEAARYHLEVKQAAEAVMAHASAASLASISTQK